MGVTSCRSSIAGRRPASWQAAPARISVGLTMSTTVQQPLSTPAAAPAERPAPAPAATGDPAVLGLPSFVAGSVALGLALVGYVSAGAGGAALPIILMATGLGLIVSAVWAAALGQTLVACI